MTIFLNVLGENFSTIQGKGDQLKSPQKPPWRKKEKKGTEKKRKKEKQQKAIKGYNFLLTEFYEVEEFNTFSCLPHNWEFIKHLFNPRSHVAICMAPLSFFWWQESHKWLQQRGIVGYLPWY